MTNKVLDQGNRITLTLPAGLVAGAMVIFGRGSSPNFGLVGVLIDDRDSTSGLAGVDTEGVFFFNVVGKDAVGGSNQAFKAGDPVFADTDGTFDSTTNVYYGFTLTGRSGAGIRVGCVLDAISAGATTKVRVRLKHTA